MVLPDHPCRNAGDQGARGHIPGDYGACANHGSLANCDTRENYAVNADERPFGDAHRVHDLGALSGVRLGLIMGENRRPRRNGGSLFDPDFVGIEIIDDDEIADLNVRADPYATGAVERDAERGSGTEPRGKQEGGGSQSLSQTTFGTRTHTPRMPWSHLSIHRGQNRAAVRPTCRRGDSYIHSGIEMVLGKGATATRTFTADFNARRVMHCEARAPSRSPQWGERLTTHSTCDGRA